MLKRSYIFTLICLCSLSHAFGMWRRGGAGVSRTAATFSSPAVRSSVRPWVGRGYGTFRSTARPSQSFGRALTARVAPGAGVVGWEAYQYYKQNPSLIQVGPETYVEQNLVESASAVAQEGPAGVTMQEAAATQAPTVEKKATREQVVSPEQVSGSQESSEQEIKQIKQKFWYSFAMPRKFPSWFNRDDIKNALMDWLSAGYKRTMNFFGSLGTEKDRERLEALRSAYNTVIETAKNIPGAIKGMPSAVITELSNNLGTEQDLKRIEALNNAYKSTVEALKEIGESIINTPEGIAKTMNYLKGVFDQSLKEFLSTSIEDKEVDLQ